MVRDICSPAVTGPRLALCARSSSPDGIDGAWWPSSGDLGKELPDLVSVLGSKIGPIRRVVYDPSEWPRTPSRIIVGGVALSVDPYSMVERGTIYLVGTHSRDAVMYVVPPKTDTAIVQRALQAVSDATVPMTAPVLRHLLGYFAPTGEGSAR